MAASTKGGSPMPDASTLGLLYMGLSLLISGVAVTYEIWHRPLMLDRADGRGKFPSPKMQGSELIFLSVFVAALWPVMVIAMLFDKRLKW